MAWEGGKISHFEGISWEGGLLRTRPCPRAVDGVGEEQALGKRRGLREDRRLRVGAI